VAVLILSGIGLTVAVPHLKLSVRQAKEEELRFCLGEFRRAIGKFRDRWSRDPASLQELLRDEKGMPFLRRLYDDPITGRPDWVFVPAASDPAFIRIASGGSAGAHATDSERAGMAPSETAFLATASDGVFLPTAPGGETDAASPDGAFVRSASEEPSLSGIPYRDFR